MNEIESKIEEIREIPDPIERARTVGEVQVRLQNAVNELSHIRREAIDELISSGMRQVDVAKALDLTRGRLNKLVTTGPGPERALLAPNARIGTVVTVAWAEKITTDQRPGMIPSTHQAHLKIDRLAAAMNLKTHDEAVPEGGVVDLNRDNLVVLIGPRITPLIAQAISADPAIQWRKGDNDWFIFDGKTQKAFHSDFSNRTGERPGPGVCYAHIGRVRRPDGRGSFLYLGGIHAEGTAGAVEFLTNNIASLWEQVRRGMWSAVIRTSVADDGSIVSADLATDIYIHTKR